MHAPLAAAAGAAALVLAFPPFDLFPLGLLAFAPLWLAVRDRSPSHALLLGLLMGGLTYAGGFYWVTTTLRDFAYMGWPLTLALLVLLCAWGGLAFGVWAAGAVSLVRATRLPAMLVGPPLFIAVEHLWPLLFPWHLGGALHGANVLAQAADLGGMSLLSLLVASVGLGAAETISRLRARGRYGAALRPLGVAAGLLVLALGYGVVRGANVAARMAAAPRLRLGLVQGNIGIYDKERQGLAAANTRHFVTLSQPLVEQGAALVVWPETAVQEPVELARPIPPAYARLGVPLLTGGLAVRRDGARREYYNVAYLLEGGRVRGIVPKNELMLFGEYLPLERTFPGLRRYFPNTGGLTAGTWTSVLTSGPAHIGVLICYEDVVPAFARRVANLSPAPNLLVNLTNDSWFGASTEPFEHAYLASFRAIELRRALVRATNTGVSCLIDPRGRVVQRSGLFRAETLLGDVPLLDGRSVYARLGDWPAYAALGWVLVLLALALGRRGRRQQSPPI